jgi:uncharacterized protein YkwD
MGHRFLPLVVSLLALSASASASASAGAAAGAAASAASTPLDLARGVRSKGCRSHAGISTPLHDVGALKDAALSVSRGLTLQNAIARSGYRDQESTVIHFSGDGNTLQQMLSNQLCDLLLNSEYSDIGITQRGFETWMILAVPFTPPAAANASAVVADLLQRINLARAHSRRCGSKLFPAAPPLRDNALLRAAAQVHARDMVDHNYFAHVGPDGSTPAQRVTAEGYVYRMTGENIASGPTTAAEAVTGWINSPEHCENLMDTLFTDSGVAFAASAHGPPRIYWVQEFGTPR